MIVVIHHHHHHPLVTHRTVDHDHGGVRNPSLQRRPRSHPHGGGEVAAVIRMTPRTVGGRNHRHERIRIGGRRVVVGGVTARTVVEVAAVTAPMTPGRPADERPGKRRPPVKEPPPSHPHLESQRNPRLKSTTPAMPIRECVPSTPIFVYGESHVWGDGRMCYGNVRRVLRRRKRSLVIMQVVLVG